MGKRYDQLDLDNRIEFSRIKCPTWTPTSGSLTSNVKRRENHQIAIGCTGSQTPGRRTRRLEMDERKKWLVRKDKRFRPAATWGGSDHLRATSSRAPTGDIRDEVWNVSDRLQAGIDEPIRSVGLTPHANLRPHWKSVSKCRHQPGQTRRLSEITGASSRASPISTACRLRRVGGRSALPSPPSPPAPCRDRPVSAPPAA